MLTRFRIIFLIWFVSIGASHAQGITVSKAALDGGSTEAILFSFTAQNRVSGVEIVRPGFVEQMNLESIRSFQGGAETPIWLTTDSVKFQKRIPHTAWIRREGKNLRIEFATDIAVGDKIELGIQMSIADKSENKNTAVIIRTWDRARPNSMTDHSTNALSIKERNSKN